MDAGSKAEMKTLYCYSTNKLGPLIPRDFSWLWGEKQQQQKNTIRVNEHTFPKYKTYYTELLRRQWSKHKNPCLQSCAGLEVLAIWIIKTDVKLHLWYQFCTHKEPSTAEAVITYLWTRTSLVGNLARFVKQTHYGINRGRSGMRSLGRHTCKTGRKRDRNHLFTLSGGLAFDEVDWQASIRRKVFLLPSPKTPSHTAWALLRSILLWAIHSYLILTLKF